MSKKTRIELFLELAKPDQNWISRRVKKDEFKGEYSDLYFENWCSWGRFDGNLAKQYIIEYDKSLTPWNRVDAIRLNGCNKWEKWTQNIKADIKKHYKIKRCVILDTSGPEVDHKNWWKNDLSVMNSSTQKLEDFQPLSKAANDAKRQHCKILWEQEKDLTPRNYDTQFHIQNEGKHTIEDQMGVSDAFDMIQLILENT